MSMDSSKDGIETGENESSMLYYYHCIFASIRRKNDLRQLCLGILAVHIFLSTLHY